MYAKLDDFCRYEHEGICIAKFTCHYKLKGNICNAPYVSKYKMKED